MWFAMGFAVAALLGVYVCTDIPLYIPAILAAILMAVMALLSLRIKPMRLLAVLLCGTMLGFSWMQLLDEVYYSIPKAADDLTGDFTITATDYSEESTYGQAFSGVIWLNGKPYTVKTYLPQDVSVNPGDTVSARFRLRCTLPGGASASSYHRSHTVFLTATPRSEVTVTSAEALPWYGYPAFVRQQVGKILDSVFPQEEAAFAKALLLGQTEDISHETDRAFQRSGIRHIIAVSGLHVTILYSLIYLLTFQRKRLASVIGILASLFFAAVAGFSASITRACIMHSLMSLGFLWKKEYDPPTALAFSGLVLLAWNPWTVSDVGFQLSFGCMIGILLFAQRIQDWLLHRKRLGRFQGMGGRLCHWFAVSVSISLSASVVTMPLCAYYFGMVSLFAAVTNLLTLWIITYIFYGVILCAILGAVFLPLAKIFSHLILWPMRYVFWVSKLISDLPFSVVYIRNIYMVLWLVVCYILLAVFLLQRRKRPLVLGCSVLICLCISLLASWTEPSWDECRVTVLDVGQGQCILLQSDGRTYMVDCGSEEPHLACQEAVAQLHSQGISRLDGLILTHFDGDHAAGVLPLLEQIQVERLYLPECLDQEGLGQQLRAAAGEKVISITDITALTFGQTHITLVPSEYGMTDNESGLCILFQTENCDILITGDRSISGEEELMRKLELPKLELLIVGHHGSKNSTGEDLLALTQPEVAVISVSQYNDYNHPSQEVLQRLEDAGCTVYRTDLDGTVIFRW